MFQPRVEGGLHSEQEMGGLTRSVPRDRLVDEFIRTTWKLRVVEVCGIPGLASAIKEDGESFEAVVMDWRKSSLRALYRHATVVKCQLHFQCALRMLVGSSSLEEQGLTSDDCEGPPPLSEEEAFGHNKYVPLPCSSKEDVQDPLIKASDLKNAGTTSFNGKQYTKLCDGLVMLRVRESFPASAYYAATIGSRKLMRLVAEFDLPDSCRVNGIDLRVLVQTRGGRDLKRRLAGEVEFFRPQFTEADIVNHLVIVPENWHRGNQFADPWMNSVFYVDALGEEDVANGVARLGSELGEGVKETLRKSRSSFLSRNVSTATSMIRETSWGQSREAGAERGPAVARGSRDEHMEQFIRIFFDPPLWYDERLNVAERKHNDESIRKAVEIMQDCLCELGFMLGGKEESRRSRTSVGGRGAGLEQ